MRNMKLKDAIALAVCRQQSIVGFRHIFVSKIIFDEGLVSNRSREKTAAFPLYTIRNTAKDLLGNYGREPNISQKFIKSFGTLLGIKWVLNSQQISNENIFCPEDLLHYAYAVFHSPDYRSRYAEFLKRDFPRLPLTSNLALFRALAHLGAELVALHLLESTTLDQPITELICSGNPEAEKPSWSQDTVWLDKRQTTGFKGVPEAVWTFHIGGYQVCHKWLKDRKGRTLSDEDIAHYQKIVVALSETIRLMREIDEVIDQHGGWPGAFQTTTQQETAEA